MSEAEAAAVPAAAPVAAADDAGPVSRNPFASAMYQRWWAGSVLGAAGVGIANVTVPLFIRDRVDEDIRAIAIAGALISLTLPGALLTLIGGTVADRTERRRILVRTYSLTAIVSLMYVLLSGLDVDFIWPVFLLAALVGASNAFGQPARQSMLPQIVSRAQLQNGVIFGMMSFMAMLQFLGPMTGGIMADLAGLTPAFALEVLLLIAAAAVFSTIATDRPVPSGASVLADLVAGMRYVRSRPQILALLCLGTVPGIFFISPFMVTIALYVPDLLEKSDKWVGILSGCFGSGVVIGSIVLAARPIPRRGLSIIIATISGGVVLGVYGLSDHVALSAVTLFVWGLGAAVFINYASGLIQEQTEAHVMGRVMSMYFLSFQLAQPVGFVLTGAMVTFIGLREALVANGAAALIIGVACLLFLKPVRELR